MLETQEVLGDTNRDLNSGLQLAVHVSHDEWQRLKDACIELGSVFRDEVFFSWEE